MLASHTAAPATGGLAGRTVCAPACGVRRTGLVSRKAWAPTGFPSNPRPIVPRAAVTGNKGLNGAEDLAKEAKQVQENEVSDVVEVKIDNHSEPFATLVTINYGNKLGELLDTVAALKSLGLNITRAKLRSTGTHKFYITDAETSEKVVRSSRLEEIRLTILNNMLRYHPETSQQLAWGSPSAYSGMNAADDSSPLGVRNYGIKTQVEVREDKNGLTSKLLVNTLDRPGLLTDIVHILKDINLNVISAEVDTIGRNAFDIFQITYHGEPLPPPMCQLVVNSLQYYLSANEVEKSWAESY
ncbi:CGL93 [Auxenochlorella protothecoides x Auxenochlorella symbiontica]